MFTLRCEGKSSLIVSIVEQYYENNNFNKTTMDELWKLKGSTDEVLYFDNYEDYNIARITLKKLLIQASIDLLIFALELR